MTSKTSLDGEWLTLRFVPSSTAYDDHLNEIAQFNTVPVCMKDFLTNVVTGFLANIQ